MDSAESVKITLAHRGGPVRGDESRERVLPRAAIHKHVETLLAQLKSAR